MASRRYLDDCGRILEVSKGLGEDSYMTMRNRHRVKSPALPVRTNFEEAQADLDAYAAKHDLKEYR